MLKEGVILVERYEIISRIGAGGMADVYKAKDHKLNRMVAVKVLKPEFRADKTFINKFRTEAQAAAGLSHPNIVNVFDVGEDRGVYFIVMELVEGITLKDYITRKGKLSVKEATSIAIQVSLGLEAAHNRNIVHRDVKPQNIIISTDGKVKLSDFGIAKATSSNTISSNVMGSVHYSSPEQVRGGYSDYKSDIYSLGITMYEMVTGRVPFDGDTTVAIAIKHLQEEIESPSKYTPNLPFALEQIILKCTQKSPDRRYNNMAELIDDLKHSLMDPQGNFVVMTPLGSHAQTVMVSDEELGKIRSGAAAKAQASSGSSSSRYSKIDDDEEEDDYDEDFEGEDDDDDDYEDDYEDDDDESGNKLEKAITIGGFIIAAIIICMLIYFIGQAAGIFGGRKTSDGTSSASSAVSVSEDQDAEKVAVPDLFNKTEAEATDLANSLNLGVAKGGLEPSDEVEEGKICRQEPAAGSKVDKNTTITYYVSSGKGNVTIPTGLIGQSQSAVEAALEQLGLTSTPTQAYDDEVAIGNVISIDPEEGASVPVGTNVAIVVSKGPEEEEEIRVIDVVGMSEEDAKNFLKDFTIVTTTGTTDRVAIGEVMQQDPAGNTMAKRGSTVTLVINTAKPTATPEPVDPGTTPQPTDVTWTCQQSLSAPEKYQGGVAKIELIQEQDGDEIIVYQNDGITISSWPYAINATWEAPSSASSTGRIIFYEMDASGNYQAIDQYPSVPLNAG
ncbi:MAG: Stk1 family PASTA domain-containing Ser/Thr kinase [Fusicatenibacter sp.]|nr:Stk1 family PASTA domain-containing Ser/Thr kinase [Fusicatenibacter sp.]